MPQLPQLPGLVFVSTHSEPQSVWPEAHDVEHTLLTQAVPDAHAWPHEPQLAFDDVVSPQDVSPPEEVSIVFDDVSVAVDESRGPESKVTPCEDELLPHADVSKRTRLASSAMPAWRVLTSLTSRARRIQRNNKVQRPDAEGPFVALLCATSCVAGCPELPSPALCP